MPGSGHKLTSGSFLLGEGPQTFLGNWLKVKNKLGSGEKSISGHEKSREYAKRNKSDGKAPKISKSMV